MVSIILFAIFSLVASPSATATTTYSYAIVDTGVTEHSSNSSLLSTAPAEGEAFYGQDADYTDNWPSYTDNGDDTVTDEVTGLMWQKYMTKYTFDDASTAASECTTGNYTDWRVPTLKELYSLINFDGDVMGSEAGSKMFIDTDFFDHPLGDTDGGEREIDAQTWSSTEYTGTTMIGDATVFGVNFVDGRIKGYPKVAKATEIAQYFRFVRGNTDYGTNDFSADRGVITDHATGLMWTKNDNGEGVDWEAALAYCQDLNFGGYSDWRLPDAKQLQSIVDYSKGPQTTFRAAITNIFSTSTWQLPEAITNDGGLTNGNTTNFPYFWSSTTHKDGPSPYEAAVYVCFGECVGKMDDIVMDVHGAGAQRSDPKWGDDDEFPDYFGPQGDMRSTKNYVKCVRRV